MTLKDALIGTGMPMEDVDEAINIMIDDLNNGANPEDVLEEYGLEPDYIIDLLSLI